MTFPLLALLLLAPAEGFDRNAPLKPLPPCPAPAQASPYLTKPAPTDGKYPLPQNPELAKKRRAERAAWLHAQIVGDFDQHADAAAEGFKSCRAALVAAADKLARRGLRDADLVESRPRAFQAAAGPLASHPLLRLWDDRNRQNPLGGGGTGRTPGRPEADEAAKLGYRPLNQLYLALTAISPVPANEDPKRRYHKQFLAALAVLAKDPHPEAAYWVGRFAVLAAGFDAQEDDSPEALAGRLADALKACGAAAAVRDTTLGKYWIDQAWAARGGAPGAQVPPEAFQQFRKLLEKAGRLLEAAHEADPASPTAAAHMITVCKGLSRKRPEMEEWFRKALEADPDNWEAVTAKADYLLPRWFGSVAELTAFGRQCVRAGNHDSHLATVMLTAHEEATAARGEADLLGDPLAYADQLAAYEPVARHRPADRYVRTQLVRLLDTAGHVQAAWAHAAALNEALWLDPGEDWMESDRFVKILKRRAALSK